MTLKEQEKIHDKLRNPKCRPLYRTTDLVSPTQHHKKGVGDYKRDPEDIYNQVYTLCLDPSQRKTKTFLRQIGRGYQIIPRKYCSIY